MIERTPGSEFKILDWKQKREKFLIHILFAEDIALAAESVKQL